MRTLEEFDYRDSSVRARICYRYGDTHCVYDGVIYKMRELHLDRGGDVYMYYAAEDEEGGWEDTERMTVDPSLLLLGIPDHGWVTKGRRTTYIPRKFVGKYKQGWQASRDTDHVRWRDLINPKHYTLSELAGEDGALTYNYAIVDGTLHYRRHEIGVAHLNATDEWVLRVPEEHDFVMYDDELLDKARVEVVV